MTRQNFWNRESDLKKEGRVRSCETDRKEAGPAREVKTTSLGAVQR